MQEAFSVQMIMGKDWLVHREVTVNGSCGCVCAETLKVRKWSVVIYENFSNTVKIMLLTFILLLIHKQTSNLLNLMTLEP